MPQREHVLLLGDSRGKHEQDDDGTAGETKECFNLIEERVHEEGLSIRSGISCDDLKHTGRT